MTISERIIKSIERQKYDTGWELAKQVGISDQYHQRMEKESQILLRIRSWIFEMYCR